MEAVAARPCQHARQAVWSEQILSRHALKAIAQVRIGQPDAA
jgi:hypothetical protein